MAQTGNSSDDGSEQGIQRRRGIYLTIDEVEPYGEESVENIINDRVFYQAGDLMIPARPDSGFDMRHGPSGRDLDQGMEERKETRIKKTKGNIRAKATK